MTCYFRHLQQIFRKAGIEVTKENRKEIDKIIQSIVGTEHKNCPDTWREAKKKIAEHESSFVSQLEAAWKKQASN